IDEDEPSNLNWNPKGKNLTTVYKNYNHNEQYLKDMISLRFFTLKEKLDIFDWEVKEETKEILGFLCQLATGHFRGRDYEAWFALELPQGGPWKYDGLPGLILEI